LNNNIFCCRIPPRLVAILFDMAPLFALLGLLGFLTSFVSATALTYKLPPNGKECFYSHIEQKGAKVAFYFAVCLSLFCRQLTRTNATLRFNLVAPSMVHDESTRLTIYPSLTRHRSRLCSPRTQRRARQRKNHPRRHQGTPGRLCLHRQRGRRIPFLLRQQHQHLCRQDDRL
jgi:hypothetical protein